MNKPHPKYNIKKGDTIQTISEFFGVDENVWTMYHNNMCRLTDIIREILPSHLVSIYLLPELWDKADALNSTPSIKELSEKRANQRVEFGYENTLILKRSPELLEYNVTVVLLHNEKINTIKYNVSVRWIDKVDKNHIIEVNRISKTFINEMEPNLMADELAVKVASTLYPLEFIVTQKEGITEINNFEDIQKRWANIKQEIKDYYSGETLKKYLQLNDKVLDSKETLLRSLQNDWFVHAYFNKIYQSYGSEYSFTNTIRAPFVFDTDGIEYTVEQKIDNLIDENGFINVSMKGEVSDKRSEIDLENGSNIAKYDSERPLTGNYSAQYILEHKHHTLEVLKLDCSLNRSDNNRVSIIISRIKK